MTLGDPGAVAQHGQMGKRLLRLLAAFVVVNALLVAPSWIRIGWIDPSWIAFEAGILVILFAMLPARAWSSALALLAALAVTAVAVIGVGNSATWLSLGRPLNLYLDLWLLRSVGHLLTGMLGSDALVYGLWFVAAAVLVISTLGVARLLRPSPHRHNPLSHRVAAVALLAWATMGLTAARVPAVDRLVDMPGVQLVREQAQRFVQTKEEEERFAADLARSQGSHADTPGLLGRLENTDVILAFLESYGMVSLYDPRYAPVVGARVDDLEVRMRDAGLNIVSGRLVAPSQGGQSWFGHGSLLSGLWLDNQLRYDMLLASGRETLIDDFERLGHHTVAVMPAITMAWPEGDRFGYDEIFVHRSIGYAGPPLNWVTMPDQFTWSFIERQRERHDRPVLIEVGLVSSHAPWTPILPVLDEWESIGDGTVFSKWKDAGERPEELWRDTDRVREQYALSVEYAVHAMTAYAERYVDERTLLIVLGDHQPAPLITGDGASWEVPVHVISGDPELLAPFLEWGFVRGAWPPADPTALGMDYFRDWFVNAYSVARGHPGTRGREVDP